MLGAHHHRVDCSNKFYHCLAPWLNRRAMEKRKVVRNSRPSRIKSANKLCSYLYHLSAFSSFETSFEAVSTCFSTFPKLVSFSKRFSTFFSSASTAISTYRSLHCNIKRKARSSS